LLYGMDGWTLKVSTMNKLELSVLRYWCTQDSVDCKKNQNEVLRKINKDRELFQFLQLIIEGKIEETRGIDRKKMSWLRNVRQCTGLRTMQERRHTLRNTEE